jgi:DNA primase
VCPLCGGRQTHRALQVWRCFDCNWWGNTNELDDLRKRYSLPAHRQRTESNLHPIRLKVATFPPGYKDVCDLLASGQDALYERMIAEAKPASAWAIDHVEDLGPDLSTPEGQQEAAELLLEMLAALPVLEREARVKQFAQRMEIQEHVLRKALNEMYAKRHGRTLKRRRDASMEIP